MSEPSPAPSQGPADDDEHLQGGAIRVRLFGRTDVGQVREHNEDNFIVADLTRKSRGLMEADRSQTVGARGTLMAVCDGMGGAAAGEVASQLAVDIIFERMCDGDTPKARDEFARRIVRAIEDAGARIYQEAKADRTRRGMGTTSTVAALIDDHLFLGQVGDSRGYILRNGKFVQVTRDQSLVNQLIEAGQLTEEEAETFEHNNIILQALGTSDTVQVDLTFVELRRGDTLLLCSDGLSGMVRADEMREVMVGVPDPLEACKLLTEKANQAGGHDNITCIVAKFDGPGLKKLNEGDPDLKYRKYPLSDDPPVNASSMTTQPIVPPRTGDRMSEHGGGSSKLANTVVGLNLNDIAAKLPAGALDGSKKDSSAPPAGVNDVVDLPIAPTPPWLVAAAIVFALLLVAVLGLFLLK